MRKISSLKDDLDFLPIPLQKTKTYFHSQFKRKFSYAYFDLLCSKANILNQKITDSSDEEHLPSCCNGLMETIDHNNRVESGQIGIIFIHYDSHQKTRFDHLNIRNIFASNHIFHIDFGLDILEKYWLKSTQPILFVFSYPNSLEPKKTPYKINLSGILLNDYFQKNNITKDYINKLREKNINHLSIQLSANDTSNQLNVGFLNAVKIYKNTQLLKLNTYFSQQKIHDENQQIGRFGEQFVKYRCFEYGYMVKPKTYDFGIDFMFYSFNENRVLEEHIAHFQIKSQRKSDIKNGFVHKSIKSKDIQTWINYLGPVFLIVVDVSTSSMYWTFIKTSMAQTNANTTVKIPVTNVLNETGLATITSLKNQFS
jgi:hypothetical protein